MSNIIKVEHHGATVSVQEHLNGKHREHCLCWLGCMHFHPESREDNCKIANAVYQNCVDYHIVAPIWECSYYEK